MFSPRTQNLTALATSSNSEESKYGLFGLILHDTESKKYWYKPRKKHYVLFLVNSQLE